jgi:GDPmannose 4,6-dehydratase
LIGDATKAATVLGWKARALAPELARIMVDADLAAVNGLAPGARA